MIDKQRRRYHADVRDRDRQSLLLLRPSFIQLIVLSVLIVSSLMGECTAFVNIGNNGKCELSSIPRNANEGEDMRQQQQRRKLGLIIRRKIRVFEPLWSGSTSSGISVEKEEEEPNKVSWTRPTLEIAVPALIGMMADPVLSLIDTFFVSQIGPNPLAALGACTSIFHLAFNAFRATTTATTSLVASAQPDPDSPSENYNAQFVTTTSLQLSIVAGVLVSTFLLLFSTPILSAMNIPPPSSLSPPAKSYLNIRALAAPAVLYCVVSEGAFRGYGDTKIPLLASFTAAILNLVLDPVLMFPCRMGVGGAALATALSQVGAMLVYRHFLKKRSMLLPPSKPQSSSSSSSSSKKDIAWTIFKANLTMMLKQGSLLFGWAYATSQATKIGATHVAAHQVALSFWLIFALIMDGGAVAAQVLMSRLHGDIETPRVLRKKRSLIRYMTKFALLQGLLSSAVIYGLGRYIPTTFSSNNEIQAHLGSIMPILVLQQILISLTLVLEFIVVGCQKFKLLAVGTAISTLVTMKVLSGCESIVGIWKYGIVSLFVGRLSTAVVGTVGTYWGQGGKEEKVVKKG